MQEGQYQVSIREEKNNIEVIDGAFFLNGNKMDIDISKINDITYHIISNGRSINVHVIEHDKSGKTYTFQIDGLSYPVRLENKLDMLLEKLGMNKPVNQKNQNVMAPMPGLLLSLKVKPGESVNVGDKLLVLEAMKMENVIKAAGNGVVKKMHAKVGESVEVGQLLISFEE